MRIGRGVVADDGTAEREPVPTGISGIGMGVSSDFPGVISSGFSLGVWIGTGSFGTGWLFLGTELPSCSADEVASTATWVASGSFACNVSSGISWVGFED